ncbi:MAG: hypothetical protein ACYC1D_08940, partial [Acidimicrobiales bacterium]
MPFTPGPGVGGHCLPVDPSYLSWRVRQRLGRSFRFIELANVVSRLAAALNKKRRAVTAAGSSCSVWPTSATPATPASLRPSSSCQDARLSLNTACSRRSTRTARSSTAAPPPASRR